MCRAAQEASAPHRGYIDRKKENVIFTPLYLGEPNLLQGFLLARGVYIPNLKENTPAISKIQAAKVLSFFSVFSFFVCVCVFLHTCKNYYKMQTRTPIALKFGIQKRNPKANPSITFGANAMNGSGVMTDYSRRTRSICCHAYRVNRFME